MKKVAVCTTAVILMLTGCSAKSVSMDSGCGLDLKDAVKENAVFRIYQTDPEDHSWKLLETYTTVVPEENWYVDTEVIVPEDETGTVTLVLKQTHYVSNEKGEGTIYESSILGECSIMAEGYQSGREPDYSTMEIQRKDGEQAYHLYAFQETDKGSMFEAKTPDPERPYDEENCNLTNVLVTITLN